jgi:diacylglycerol kinase family enzyme
LEADGEFLGECPAEFTILEKAIRVIVPSWGGFFCFR